MSIKRPLPVESVRLTGTQMFREAAQQYRNRNMEVSNRNMSYNERLRKASKYCERNGSYRVIAGCGEKKLLLVRNATGYVRTALLGE